MTTDDARRRSLGRLVRKRRELLGLSIDEAAARAPMGPTTWARVEQGKAVRGLTLPGIDKVLGWAEDACNDYLATSKEPALRQPTQAAIAGQETVTPQGDATVTTMGNPPTPETALLQSEPPFARPTSRTQEAANRYWEALRMLAEGDGEESPPNAATVRVIQRGAVDVEELRQSLGGGG